jgi:uncharacterized membrane protein YtjA (UPF0391 family)
MLEAAVFFFIVSLVAGVLGFTNVAAGARRVAKILFFIAIAIFIVVVLVGLALGKLIF